MNHFKNGDYVDVDMSLFAGSDVWLQSRDNGERWQVDDLPYKKYLDKFEPVYNIWNHFEGHEMPAYLEPFEFEVRFFSRSDNKYVILDGNPELFNAQWSKVCSFKITGLKEGYTFGEK